MVNILSTISHYYFSLGISWGYFKPRKKPNWLCRENNWQWPHTKTLSVKPKKYYPALLQCSEFAVGALQWLQTGACREKLRSCVLRFLLPALPQLRPALKVSSPLLWQFRRSFVPEARQWKKRPSELNPGVAHSAGWAGVEGCRTWRRRRRMKVAIHVTVRVRMQYLDLPPNGDPWMLCYCFV